MASWNTGPHSQFQLHPGNNPPQQPVLNEIDAFMPIDPINIIEPPLLYQDIVQDDGMPPAIGHFYLPDAFFEALAPPSPVVESILPDLKELRQLLAVNIDSHSSDTADHHAVQEPVTATTGGILSTEPSLPMSSNHSSVATTGGAPAHAAINQNGGISITSTLETGGPSLQEHTTAMDRGFRCQENGCAKLYKRRDTLKNHVQRAHSHSNIILMCPEPDCGKMFGFLPELKRHSEVHGSDARHCPCLGRWFARRGLLIAGCPYGKECPGAVDRRRRTAV